MSDTIATCRKLDDERNECDCPLHGEPCLACAKNALDGEALQCDCLHCPKPWGAFCGSACLERYHDEHQARAVLKQSRRLLACDTPRPKTLRGMLAHVGACPHPVCCGVRELYREVVAVFRRNGARVELYAVGKE